MAWSTRGRPGEDRGSTIPAFLALVWVTLMMGVLFSQIGRATDLSAEAQTGTDAAALAGAESIALQILQWLMTTAGGGGVSCPPDPTRGARIAAEAYAGRNGVRIEDFQVQRLGCYSFDVHVVGETLDGLDAHGSRSTDPATGEQREVVIRAGGRAEQQATARVQPGTTSFLSGRGFASGGGAGGATSGGGSCPVPDSDVRAVADELGLPPEEVQQSVLGRYAGCGDAPGVSVSGLTRAMQVSLVRLEQAMGEPLNLSSGFRTPAYQAILCRRVSGPCAPPGRSLHGEGLAVDVGNWARAAVAVSSDPSIGLCQPLPANDAVHFSHVSGRECGGRIGASNTGGLAGGGFSSPLAYGGFPNLRRLAPFDVTLVR